MLIFLEVILKWENPEYVKEQLGAIKSAKKTDKFRALGRKCSPCLLMMHLPGPVSLVGRKNAQQAPEC